MKGRTVAEIEELTGDARTREIGRMLSGQRVTPEALKHAEQLIRLGAGTQRMQSLRLRSSEWLLVIYFGYVAAIAPRFPLDQQQIVWRPFLVVLLVALYSWRWPTANRASTPRVLQHHAGLGSGGADSWWLIARWIGSPRCPAIFDLELRWVEWDRSHSLSAGLAARRSNRWARLVPAYLELCYVLVYAVAPFLVAVLYFQHRRERVNGVLFLYLLGTLLAYALFPYFPSDPPRVAVRRKRHAECRDRRCAS